MAVRLWVAVACAVVGPASAFAQDGGTDAGAPDGGVPFDTSLCPEGAVGCDGGDVDFFYREEGLFDDLMFDSGWVPPSSPIQLRIVFFIGGNTEVEMGGTVVTSWPAPLTVAVPGRAGTGRLSMAYGIELAVMLRFDIEVGGIRYTWSGDIPIPGLPDDLLMAAEAGFDPFLLLPSMPRPVTIEDETDPVPVLRYDALGSLISIPGVGGGIELTLQGDLRVGYQSDRVVVGDAMPIVEEGASTVAGPDPGGDGFGAAKDVVVHPEGTLFYDGVIRAAPTLYLTFAGSRREYPLTEIPIPVADVDSNVVFDERTVHVPLPDADVSPRAIDFGTVVAGAEAEALLTVANDGEAPLEVSVRTPAAPFAVEPASLAVPPSSEARITVRYAPVMAGGDAAMLFLETNDPDESLLVVRLSGEATGAEFPVGDAGPPPDAGPGGVSDEGGCGCRAAGRRAAAPWALGIVALAAVSARASRRRRRSARALRG